MDKLITVWQSILDILAIIFYVVAVFIFVYIIVSLFKPYLQGETIINYIRIQRLKRMIRRDENDYQQIFVLTKKVKLTDHNKFLSFRVSYLKTFGKEFSQYTFEHGKPFVSLEKIKTCNSVEELKKIIEETKTIDTRKVYTHSSMAAFFIDIDEYFI